MGSVSTRRHQITVLDLGNGNRGGVVTHKRLCGGGRAAAIAAGAANVCNVTIQAVDGAGLPISGARRLTAYLSTATGSPGTAASSSLSVTGATQITATTSAVEFVTKDDGSATLVITDTAKTQQHVSMVAGGQAPIISRQLVTADYG